MIIEIVIINPHKRMTYYVNPSDLRNINHIVYETLCKYGIEEKIAIDCACWCELAEYEESYNEENFDVYIWEY